MVTDSIPKNHEWFSKWHLGTMSVGQNMVVVHITAAGAVAAGQVTFDLHKSMLASGIESWLLTAGDSAHADNVLRLHRTPLDQNMYHLWRLVKSRFRGEKRNGVIADPEYHFNKYSEMEYYRADNIAAKLPTEIGAIVIHFYDALLNTSAVADLGRQTSSKVLWLMMDMFPLTGGCHYSWGCKGYEGQCGCCPAIKSSVEKDRSREQFLQKRAALDSYNNIEIVTASEWQYRQARSSSLFRDRRVHKILTAVHPEQYYPREHSEVIYKAGIKGNKTYILFGARYLNERRKGFDLFVQAMKKLEEYIDQSIIDETMVLLAGEGNVDAMKTTKWKHHHFGVLDKNQFAEVLGIMDLYVCASIEDSGPTMINQAIMSGVPVISFEMGVALDLVEDDVTGYRVQLGNVEAMAERIATFLGKTETQRSNMRNGTRALGMSKLTPERQVEAYMRCINETI